MSVQGEIKQHERQANESYGKLVDEDWRNNSQQGRVGPFHTIVLRKGALMFRAVSVEFPDHVIMGQNQWFSNLDVAAKEAFDTADKPAVLYKVMTVACNRDLHLLDLSNAMNYPPLRQHWENVSQEDGLQQLLTAAFNNGKCRFAEAASDKDILCRLKALDLVGIDGFAALEMPLRHVPTSESFALVAFCEPRQVLTRSSIEFRCVCATSDDSNTETEETILVTINGKLNHTLSCRDVARKFFMHVRRNKWDKDLGHSNPLLPANQFLQE